MSKVWFILASTIFVLFLIQVGAMIGASIVTGGGTSITTPTAPSADPISNAIWVVQNIGFFFTLMTVDSSFLIFGSVIILGYVISMIWAVIEVIRGV